MTMSPRQLPAAQLRAGDTDRDATISQLSDHFGAGRLTAEELDERSGRALSARTLGELDELMSDLPASLNRYRSSGSCRRREGPVSSAGCFP